MKTAIQAFLGMNDSGARLVDLLRQRGIERIFVGGLATDYCVKHTVLDGLRENFKVALLTDSVRGVNLKPGDSERAIRRNASCRRRDRIGLTTKCRINCVRPSGMVTGLSLYPFCSLLNLR